MRKLLTITALTAMLLGSPVVDAAQLGGAFTVGAWKQGSQSSFLVSPGASVVLLSDTAKRVRVLSYGSFLYANQEGDEVESILSIEGVQKWFPVGKTKLWIFSGVGFQYEIEAEGDSLVVTDGETFTVKTSGENQARPAFVLQFGISVYRFASFAFTAGYVPYKGPDAYFLGGTVDLINSF